MNKQNYSGNVSPSDCYEAMSLEENSYLVDVRTVPEWSFVGIPDLSSLKKEIVQISWRIYPSMQINENFIEDFIKSTTGIDKKTSKIFFICKSGGRSKEAAMALYSAGYEQCFNVEDGFEGIQNSEGQRGVVCGWKASGLPWVQY